jgi:hypothetical protein
VVGGAVAFLLAAAIYLLLNPLLQDASGLVRALQGPLWNIVPVFTAEGLASGWSLATR